MEILSLYFQQFPMAFIAVSALFGLLVGSFLNVVIHRLPIMMERDWRGQCAELLDCAIDQPQERYDLIMPRSTCPQCQHSISALENIPVLSYLLLGGKCKGCKAPISIRYPIVELLTALFSGLIAYYFGFGVQAGLALLLTWSLIALSFIDADTQLLPDSITLPLLWLGIACNVFGLYTDLSSSVIGAMAGYLSLWSVYMGFKLLTGKEGMGHGDFKLLAMLGAWMGWQYLPVIIILSSLVGAVIGVSMMLIKSADRNTQIPFGPYLACAGWLALIWGADITNVYLAWITA